MVTKETLHYFFKLLYQECGLLLDESKRYLIESRLEPVAVQEGFDSIGSLAKELKNRSNRELRQKVIDAMTTHETSFFRDVIPFLHIREVLLPQLMKTNKASKTLRIWSAACSSGQEAYTLAILLREMKSVFQGWKVEIIATDISESVLKQAKSGVYSQHEVQRGLSTHQLLQNFTQEGLAWKVKPEIKEMIQFRKLNILSSFSSIGEVDIVFCRNILIYFDSKTKKDVIHRITNLLSPEGVLFLGSAEALLGIGTSLVRVDSKKVVYYRKKAFDENGNQEGVNEIKRRRVCQI